MFHILLIQLIREIGAGKCLEPALARNHGMGISILRELLVEFIRAFADTQEIYPPLFEAIRILDGTMKKPVRMLVIVVESDPQESLYWRF